MPCRGRHRHKRQAFPLLQGRAGARAARQLRAEPRPRFLTGSREPGGDDRPHRAAQRRERPPRAGGGVQGVRPRTESGRGHRPAGEGCPEHERQALMTRVGIVDYEMGNLRSVEKGLQKVGVDASICAEAESFDSFDGLVLPGVGAFGDAMENLKRLGMDEAIREYIATGRHLLGICLGMQLLLEYSEEHGRNEGLGIVPGGCLRLPDTVKVPHMGWNILNVTRENQLFEGLGQADRFYFVHSFYCAPSDGSWTCLLYT